MPSGCQFKNRREKYIGGVCDKVSPPLEAKSDIDDEREVVCHLYESAEGYDSYADISETKPEEHGESAESSAD